MTAGDSTTTLTAFTVHWIIKLRLLMQPAVFFRIRLRLSLPSAAALPTPVLALNLLQGLRTSLDTPLMVCCHYAGFERLRLHLYLYSTQAAQSI